MSDRRDIRGDERPWGEVTCGFGLREPQCDESATAHVLWLEDSQTSTTCDEHLRFIHRTSSIAYETHTFGHDCGMPGSMWHHPYEDEEEGYCFFPAPDDASLVASADLPLVVDA